MRLIPTLTLLGALGVGAASPAAVIYETDFSTKSDGNPFNAALLQFQDGWLGQNFTNVDPSGSGTADTPSTTVFPRNLNNRGALGNQAGGPGGPGEVAGPGFTVGDKIRINTQYQFTLDGRFNRDLATFGVRNNFVNGGFNASPIAGFELFYSEFQSSSGGGLKLFGDFERVGTNGADNAFALIVPGLDIGLDPDGVSGPADLDSDTLEIDFEMTYLGSDEWQTTGLTLTNATTSTLLRDAAVDQPAILTETQIVPSDNDLFLGIQWMRNPITNSSVDSIRYEYIAAIPEPSSAVLGLAGLPAFVRRRG